MTNKVVVTGGAGFIGSHLVDKLIEEGKEVIVLDNLSTGKRKNLNTKAHLIMCDISKTFTGFLAQSLEDVDTVFHLAAKTAVQESLDYPHLYNETNINGILNILEAARMTKVKRVIFSSSSSVYGNAEVPTKETHPANPLSNYALTKLIGEEYCKLYSTIYDIDTVSLRYFNAYGDRMNNEGGYKLVLPIFKEQSDNNKPLTINNDGEQRRDFIHVSDICNANILCANYKDKFKGEVYNVGEGKNYSVNEIADMFEGEKSYGNKVIEPFETLAAIAKIKTKLNWKPISNLSVWIKKYKTLKIVK